MPAPSWAARPGTLFLTSDGQTLIGSDRQLTQVNLWRWGEGKETILRVPRRDGPLLVDSSTHVCISPDGKLLAIGPHSREPLGIWDVATGIRVLRHRGAGGRFVLLARWQVAGRRVHEPRRRRCHGPALVRGAHGQGGKANSPHEQGFLRGARLLAGREDARGGRHRRHLPAREPKREGTPSARRARTGRQRMALFSPDGKVLASTSLGRIHLWDTATGKELDERPGNLGEVRCATYTADSRLLATGGWVEPTLALWIQRRGGAACWSRTGVQTNRRTFAL